MAEDHQRRDTDVDPLMRREAVRRARAECRLIEQELAMRWGLFAITIMCSLVGLGLLLAGESYGGATALAAATGSGALSRHRLGGGG